MNVAKEAEMTCFSQGRWQRLAEKSRVYIADILNSTALDLLSKLILDCDLLVSKHDQVETT